MRIRILLILVLVSIASTLHAQKSGEILVLTKSGIDASTTRLVDALKPLYPGVVTLRTDLPEVLLYDAVMMIDPGTSKVIFDSLEQDRLINYLMTGGRFFAQGDAFRTRAAIDDDTTDNQFWDFIGDSSERWASAGVHIDSVYGVSGSFMTGLSAAQPYDPARIDFPSLLEREGMTSVLGATGNFGVSLAWISPHPEIRAALLWPIATGYYEEFIAGLVCAYFQLCALEVADREVKPTLGFDPITKQIHFPSEGRVVLTDILGRTALSQLSQSDRFRIPDHISSGTYIATWTSGVSRASVTISIP